jgi:hypothetical protein
MRFPDEFKSNLVASADGLMVLLFDNDDDDDDGV